MRTIDEELQEDARHAPSTSSDKLDKVRAVCAAARDLELEIKHLKELQSGKTMELLDLRYKTLPDLFMQARISRLDLEPDGNMPGYEARMKDHYKANIVASWPQDQQDAAFDWLEKQGQGDLIKREISISFEMEESKLFERVFKAVSKIAGIAGRVTVNRMVPWNTLTAWLKEIYEDGKELGDSELRKLGATVGKVVDIRPARSPREK